MNSGRGEPERGARREPRRRRLRQELHGSAHVVGKSAGSESTAIRIAPAATADARHELLMSSPGVRTIASSIAYSIAG